MKQNPPKSLTQRPTFEEYQEAFNRVIDYQAALKRPNLPTEEAVRKAQFVDKTYVWNKK